jgi:serine protease AprX
MSVHRYRVFIPESELETLPEEVQIGETYPAFIIVSATEEQMAAIRKSWPVEKLAEPKPPPSIPEMEHMAAAVAAPPRRGPYTKVIRFRAPVRKEWMADVEEAGCQIYRPIGSSTLVVSCPNKLSLRRLEQNHNIERITDFVPDIQLVPEFLDSLQEVRSLEEEEAAATHLDLERAGMEPSQTGQRLPGLMIAQFFTHQEQQRAKDRLRRAGLKNIAESGDVRLVINLFDSEDLVRDLMAVVGQRGLYSLSEKHVKRLHNNVARQVIAERVVDPNPLGLGLTGAGEIVAVADSGLDTGDPTTIHPDFRGRLRDIQSLPIVPSLADLIKNPGADDGPSDKYSGHGTHVSGSAVGNGTRSIALGQTPIQGTAPEAELVFQAVEQKVEWKQAVILYYIATFGEPPKPNGLFGIPDDLEELFQAAYDGGARIHSNSWGGGEPGAYDQQCHDLDRFVWDHRDMLVVVAAGNDGVDVSPPKEGVDARSVTSPGTAKNCLTVGACENPRPGEFADCYGDWWPDDFPFDPFKTDSMVDSVDDLVPFSSRGPCDTGRRKPDVVAPGTFVLSVRSSQIPANNFAWSSFPAAKNDYMFMGGTSMATPLVSGCAALVRQHLRQSAGLANPSAALLKAAMIHSAAYIHYRYARADSKPWADNEQGWGRVALRNLLNPAPPTNVLFLDEVDGVSPNEQRSFDLEVADGSVPLRITLAYTDFPGRDLINNLNLFAFEPGGSYHVGNDFDGNAVPDSDNNVEGIVVENPATGTWQIRVVGSNIPETPQSFALVVSGGGIRLGGDSD